jgi:pimeloyl-ACP methyl ester carboxylesterase
MNNVAAIKKIDYELDGLTLHGLVCGNETDDIVLCLHGWLDNAASFIPLMTQLSGKRIIAIDWPGHGLSSHRSLDCHYHFVDYVDDLLMLFEHNQWNKIAIVGHSMGAMIASAFAAAFPEKISTLSLIDSIGFISADAKDATKQLRQGLQNRLKMANKNKNKNKNIKQYSTVKSAVEARMAVSDLKYPEAELIIIRSLKKTTNGFEWRYDQRLRNISPYRFTLQQAQQIVSDIDVPVQLIYGLHGLEIVRQGMKFFSPLIEHFQCHELAGGHHIHMEKAQQSAELILQFIDAQGIEQ